jgi:hypothetical protein
MLMLAWLRARKDEPQQPSLLLSRRLQDQTAAMDLTRPSKLGQL